MKTVYVELTGGRINFLNSNQSITVQLTEEIVRAQSGEVILLKGDNGSGKSVLLKAWSGVFDKFYDDVDASDVQSRFSCGRSQCLVFPRIVGVGGGRLVKAGYLAQAPRANIFCRTVEDEIWFSLEHDARSNADKKRRVKMITQSLRESGIGVSASPDKLSKGQQQLVGFAALLSASPDVLFLDEPTASLDDDKCSWLLSQLKEDSNQNSHHLVVIATQDSRVLKHYENREGILTINVRTKNDLRTREEETEYRYKGELPQGVFGFEDIELERGEKFSLNVPSINLRNGSAHLLLGKNGTGKSSLMDCISGYSKSKKGRQYWNSVKWPVGNRKARRFMSYAFQNAEEQICFFSVKREIEHMAKYSEWSSVGKDLTSNCLGDLKQVPWHLSFGQRKMVTYFAHAFTSPVLVADEPFSSLDEENRAIVEELLNKYVVSGGILILSASRLMPSIEKLNITSRFELT